MDAPVSLSLSLSPFRFVFLRFHAPSLCALVLRSPLLFLWRLSALLFLGRLHNMRMTRKSLPLATFSCPPPVTAR